MPLYQAKAELFRTVGHPGRIRILELLSERDRAVHELAAIATESSNLSQQLGVLRLAGLVTQRRADGQVIYSLALPQVQELLGVVRQLVTHKVNDLVDVLSREQQPS